MTDYLPDFLKNRIVASVLVLILFAGGFYMVFYHYPSKIDRAKRMNQSVSKKIGSMQEIGQEYFQIQQLLQQKEEKMLLMNKVINREVTTADTYEYLNSLMEYTGFIEFDMQF